MAEKLKMEQSQREVEIKEDVAIAGPDMEEKQQADLDGVLAAAVKAADIVMPKVEDTSNANDELAVRLATSSISSAILSTDAADFLSAIEDQLADETAVFSALNGPLSNSTSFIEVHDDSTVEALGRAVDEPVIAVKKAYEELEKSSSTYLTLDDNSVEEDVLSVPVNASSLNKIGVFLEKDLTNSFNEEKTPVLGLKALSLDTEDSKQSSNKLEKTSENMEDCLSVSTRKTFVSSEKSPVESLKSFTTFKSSLTYVTLDKSSAAEGDVPVKANAKECLINLETEVSATLEKFRPIEPMKSSPGFKIISINDAMNIVRDGEYR